MDRVSQHDRLYTVETGNSARAVAGLLRVLFPDASTILDSTYGKGLFWPEGAPLRVTGLDRSPASPANVRGDFTALPFADNAFDVVVFDPPYQWDMGKGKASIIGKRFATYRDEDEARQTVRRGCQEAWRVGRLGVLVKAQDYIHASLFVEMTQWVRDAIGQAPYQRLDLMRPQKLMDPKWDEQLSVYSNSATFLAFRHGDQHHKRRRPAQPRLLEATA